MKKLPLAFLFLPAVFSPVLLNLLTFAHDRRRVDLLMATFASLGHIPLAFYILSEGVNPPRDATLLRYTFWGSLWVLAVHVLSLVVQWSIPMPDLSVVGRVVGNGLMLTVDVAFSVWVYGRARKWARLARDFAIVKDPNSTTAEVDAAYDRMNDRA